ncbi:MAG: hypothetical protein J6S19_04445 [Lentisphaeria bacterium]|nr:hypothetical protein [Lentisphaeria bacterium]
MKRYALIICGIAVAAAVLTGCGQKSDPLQRTADALDKNGSYYMLADMRVMPEQLDVMLNRITPEADRFLKNFNAPFDFSALRIRAKAFLLKTGVDKIQAAGASSKLFPKEQCGGNLWFHNRSAVALCGDSLPVFLLPFAGKEVDLMQFAARVPESAAQAYIMNLDPAALYKFLKAGKYLPDMFETMVKSYCSCSAETLFSAISGTVEVIDLNDDILQMQLVVTLPDKDNLLYKLCGKYMLFDPAKTAVFNFPNEDMPVTLRKKSDRIEIFFGKNTLQEFDTLIAGGKTMRARSDFIWRTRRLPQQANAFSLIRYSYLPVGKDDLAAIGAVKFNKEGINSYSNSGWDWNGLPFGVICDIIPYWEKIGQAVMQSKALPFAVSGDE